ncbi:unnamed protein product [Candidula unifasciata]|uniref:Uncharacterized protein n=1 Tax=Candidula unifasciata TaxID=100452 RepID=A0A8S3YMK9_9EUPU|nr:unnamed protein product [Candidula unifasciata]
MLRLCLAMVILDSIVMAQDNPPPCDVDSCVDKFSLTGDMQKFCIGVRSALECVDEIKYSHKCSNHDKWRVIDVHYRLERMSLCVCSLGWRPVFSLQLSVVLVGLAYFLTTLK